MSILRIIEIFIDLQTRLIIALCEKYKYLDDDLLLALPQTGCVEIDGIVWNFVRHGIGVRFSDSKSGRIIDVHRKIRKFPNGVDAWRLVQFIETLGGSMITEEEMKAQLNKLHAIGVLEKHDDIFTVTIRKP